jgi:endonuclease YncB( thermonuclease family)
VPARLAVAALFGAWCVLAGFAAAAEELSGPARVIDSNTLEIGGRRLRLIGVDAPDLGQTCPTRKGEAYPCGRVAAQTLVRLVKDGPLECRGERTDPAGRLLARCAIRGFDVGEQYILTGRAFADPETGENYRRAEGTAQKLREGMWRGEFQKPWEWRKESPAAKAAK